MESGAETPQAAPSRWSSPMAITAYVLVATLVVVGSFWGARTGRADAASGPAPTATASAPSAGTPRITITLTPSWESAASPDVTGASTLEAGPIGMTKPYVLAGSAATGYARLDSADGSWTWRRSTQEQPFLGWVGSTALFGDSVSAASSAGRLTVFGVTPAGVRTFVSHAGAYVTSTANRILLIDGRTLTALTAFGDLAWRTRLPSGVTAPGHVAGLAGPGGITLTPTDMVFVSRSGPGRVATVGLVDGELRTRTVAVSDPKAWIGGWGLVVGDPDGGTVLRYDTAGKLAWTHEQDGLTLLDVEGSVALVADTVARTVSLLRLQDGSTVWTSVPDPHQIAGGSLVSTDSGVVLVQVTFAGGGDPVLTSVDPITGDQRWAVAQRVLLGTWRGYALLTDPSRNELSARDLITGNPSATLNTSVTLTPDATVVLDGLVIYLDPKAGTARAVAMATG